MHSQTCHSHSHADISRSKQNETLTLIVVILTLVTMFVEIIAGLLSGSMALLSDGVHMGTHALALFITLAAYLFARKHLHNPAYSFGTGKVGVLGGYTNAILLLMAGAAMAWESVERLIHPVDIHFNEAIIVAIVGLIVNIVSAAILGRANPGHHHDHGTVHDHHEDHNLKAAYLHVITDALTSVLAIFALLTAKYFNLIWADPAVGILGAIVVAKWAIGLLRQTSSILLDKGDFSTEMAAIRARIETPSTTIQDIHIWQISENDRSVILSIVSDDAHPSGYYHQQVNAVGKYRHITVEVNKKAP